MAQARGNLFGRANGASTRDCKLVEQTGFGRFDTATVQSNDRRAFRAGNLNERAQEPRLSDSRDSMEVHHNGSFIGQNIVQRTKFLRPADEGSRYVAIQEIPNLRHDGLPYRFRDHNKSAGWPFVNDQLFPAASA
jgi:hypothetical protein